MPLAMFKNQPLDLGDQLNGVKIPDIWFFILYLEDYGKMHFSMQLLNSFWLVLYVFGISQKDKDKGFIHPLKNLYGVVSDSIGAH